MALYITRVELHYATESDYEVLHAAMARVGFHRAITSNGIGYRLPTAEYAIDSSSDLNTIKNAAKNAANTTKKGSWIMVTQSAGMALDLPRQ